MEEQNNWRIYKKQHGRQQIKASDKWEPALRQALQDLADSETQRLGRKISVSTVVSNLMTRNGAFAIEKRKELRKNYLQLKKENTNDSRREHRGQ
ncbi:hypothetical protein [Rathayibacter sp. VKM Ac-2754]|uniref:hypothetical protein n=1 Tax=Rathayibacter sp. VKM Ac-2754 TaxID=2609251 RepID=UPI00135950EE|nr:hypothetical protein [Rathayibacter sp. VKM Ac-2754]MWV58222.1 hypothetical protein [Rathayibacter sp. VKM Ac-2754]